MRLAENTGHKTSPKNRNLGTIAQLCQGYIFATKACIDNRKKNLLNSNTSSTCPDNMVNFGPLAAEIGLPLWGTPAGWLVSWMEFNVPFQHKYGYIREERSGVESYPLTQ